MAYVKMQNLYGDDNLEEYDDEDRIYQKLAQHISNILQADQDTIQSVLHKVAALLPEFRETCDVLGNQLDNLEYLALQNLGRDSQSKEFVNNKERFLSKLQKLRREASNLVTIPASNTRVMKFSANPRLDLRKELRKGLNELDFVVATERAILRLNKTMFELDIASYEGVHKTIGYAYARCIAYSFAKPLDMRPGPSVEYFSTSPIERCLETKRMFRHRLLKRCHPDDMNKSFYITQGERAKLTWCPVVGVYPESDIVAAQILPYTIGGRKAAYLLDRPEKDEYECIWGPDNGMMLAREVEKAFDEGSVVFVPFQEELRIILLNQTLSNRRINSRCNHYRGYEPSELRQLTFGKIHGRLLKFKTGHRPNVIHLYIHALMSVLRRRRHKLPGWEDDIGKVFDIGRWPYNEKLPRRGTIEALAIEVGDLLPSQIDDFRDQIIDCSRAVDTVQSEVTQQDRDVAVTVAGLWASQKQCEIWKSVAEDLWYPPHSDSLSTSY